MAGLNLSGVHVMDLELSTVPLTRFHVRNQQAQGETAQLFGSSGYFWSWMASTFENWQSEFLQLFTMVLLTAFLIHRGSTESKDSDDELMLQVAANSHQMREQAGRSGDR